MQFMLRFLRIIRDYALMLAATNYAQYYAGIMYASLVRTCKLASWRQARRYQADGVCQTPSAETVSARRRLLDTVSARHRLADAVSGRCGDWQPVSARRRLLDTVSARHRLEDGIRQTASARCHVCQTAGASGRRGVWQTWRLADVASGRRRIYQTV